MREGFPVESTERYKRDNVPQDSLLDKLASVLDEELDEGVKTFLNLLYRCNRVNNVEL